MYIIKSESENRQELLTLTLPSQSSISPLPKGSHNLLACLYASARYLEFCYLENQFYPLKRKKKFPSKEMKKL